MIDAHMIGEVAAVVVILAGNHFVGKRDRRIQSSAILEKIAEVRAFCVGPDGQNGFRKDITDMKDDFCERLDEIKDHVDGLLTRERERLERQAS